VGSLEHQIGFYNIMAKTNIKRKNWLKKKVRTKKALGVLGIYPRLVIFKSNKHIYGQLIDDTTNLTVLSSSSKDNSIDEKVLKSKNKTEISTEVGYNLAIKIKDQKIKKIVFDRNGYRFHGRVKAIADAIKEKGINI
jgi:large subunit ribosomal protein L18